ncbi:WhiB family transcriptional regulator [Streptomyces sp. NPDC019937]|uniref:WhiB family transcriptional regulator n=1 Tax=Streptomyces sp. NPDC019937 TaxID=3154787 RepID=UPI0033F80376
MTTLWITGLHTEDNDRWQIHGACADEEDPELFFPIGNTGPALLQIEEAKAVCRRCPVLEICGQWAIEQRIDHGVWGGWSEDERREILRRRGRGTGPGRKKTA